ncbi:MAG: winged helix-turn-helix transcriptional regulator [Solirubrobacterales bacterium]
MDGQSTTEPRISEGGRANELATLDILRLLSAGASGAILMALGEGPLRTKELTERVRGYTPRTVYRYASKLVEAGLIERQEEPGVPSKVIHGLTLPAGQELHDLMEAYAEASLSRLPSGEINAHAWGSLALLADLWESGMVYELNLGPRSLTELSRGRHDLSYHQVSRRANLLAIGGFVQERPNGGRRRSYALTDKARRAMALVAGIGRWRRRHVVAKGKAGLDVPEAAAVLRTALPLVCLPEHSDKSFGISVGDEDVWAYIESDGRVLGCPSPPDDPACRARGEVAMWVDMLLDGPPKSLQAEGEVHLIQTCFSRLHAALWTKWSDLPAPTASAPVPPKS